MAGDKIYQGVMLNDLIENMASMKVSIDALSENMLYLKNIYRSLDLRSSASYSSVDSTLVARKAADTYCAEVGVDCVLTNVSSRVTTALFGSGIKACISSHPVTDEGDKFVIPVTGVTSVSFRVGIYVQAGNLSACVYVNGNIVEGSQIVGNSALRYTDTLEVDTSDIDSLELRLCLTSTSGLMANYAVISDLMLIAEDGKRSLYNGAGTCAASGQTLTLASGYSEGCVVLLPVTGITVAQYDMFSAVVSGWNDDCYIDVLDNSGNVIKSSKKLEFPLSDIGTLTFYVRFHLRQKDGVSPVIEGVSYIYLT